MASKILIFHPLTLAVLIGLLALVGEWLYDGTSGSYLLIGTTFAGVVVAVLLSVRWAAGGYIDLAESVGRWTWLDEGNDSDKEDELLLTTYGNEPIGAIVMRGVKDTEPGAGSNGGTSPKRSRKQNGGNGRIKGVIRGWTVKTRYRHKGVGTGLLEEAVKISGKRGWSGPVFANDHANHGRVLPSMFNGAFDKGDRQARELLARIVDDMEASNSPTKTGKGRRW